MPLSEASALVPAAGVTIDSLLLHRPPPAGVVAWGPRPAENSPYDQLVLHNPDEEFMLSRNELFELFARHRADPVVWTPARLAELYETKTAWVEALLESAAPPVVCTVDGDIYGEALVEMGVGARRSVTVRSSMTFLLVSGQVFLRCGLLKPSQKLTREVKRVPRTGIENTYGCGWHVMRRVSQRFVRRIALPLLYESGAARDFSNSESKSLPDRAAFVPPSMGGCSSSYASRVRHTLAHTHRDTQAGTRLAHWPGHTRRWHSLASSARHWQSHWHCDRDCQCQPVCRSCLSLKSSSAGDSESGAVRVGGESDSESDSALALPVAVTVALQLEVTVSACISSGEPRAGGPHWHWHWQPEAAPTRRLP